MFQPAHFTVHQETSKTTFYYFLSVKKKKKTLNNSAHCYIIINIEQLLNIYI